MFINFLLNLLLFAAMFSYMAATAQYLSSKNHLVVLLTVVGAVCLAILVFEAHHLVETLTWRF